ncbi:MULTISPECIES: hypothetical protein [unclassified Streptomyces]|uniref:hypothetical protein n=1 Tax=unclassified Streptomyces TaxID=2593676 RepID=UPI002E801922|nr:hypothetical protein [Streptomyces sp. NBC_00589]WTI36602.1 hypothetical protein OIC96_17065 [Streptomyces sp. NBC_00775]WUB29722.1 hypothetical protein OHA51_32670 [Streptomyces sp. NBC_00589]
MDLRHTMKGRRAMAAMAITTGLLLTVSGCGGGDGDGKPQTTSSTPQSGKNGDGGASQASQTPSQDQVLAEVKGDDITLTITSAVRDQGGFVTVSGKVSNGGGKFWIASNWRGDEQELSRNGASMAGASLVDSNGKKKYLVLRDTQGRCLCTKFDGGGVDAGQSADWFAQFPAPPSDTTKVDFQVGSMPPASIEISEG